MPNIYELRQKKKQVAQLQATQPNKAKIKRKQPKITQNIMSYGLDTQIMGMDVMEYMSQLLEKNERQQVEIERGKLAVAILKQVNNRSRLLVDATKLDAKLANYNNEK
jgi:hypothetical protein